MRGSANPPTLQIGVDVVLDVGGTSHEIRGSAAGDGTDVEWGDGTPVEWGDGTIVEWDDGGAALQLDVAGVDVTDSYRREYIVRGPAEDPVTLNSDPQDVEKSLQHIYVVRGEAAVDVVGANVTAALQREYTVRAAGTPQVGAHVDASYQRVYPLRVGSLVVEVGVEDVIGTFQREYAVRAAAPVDVVDQFVPTGDLELSLGLDLSASTEIEIVFLGGVTILPTAKYTDTVPLSTVNSGDLIYLRTVRLGDSLGSGLFSFEWSVSSGRLTAAPNQPASGSSMPAMHSRPAFIAPSSPTAQVTVTINVTVTNLLDPSLSGSASATLTVLPTRLSPPAFSIDYTDRTRNLLVESLNVTHNLDSRAVLNAIVYSRGEWRPRTGERVQLNVPGDPLYEVFTGTVDAVTSTYRRPGPGDLPAGTRRIDYQITAVGLDQVLDRHIVNTVHADKTLREIVRSLVDIVALDGITMRDVDVDVGPTFERVVFSWVSVSRALYILSDLSGRDWWVSASGALHMRQRTAYAAPFGISSTDDVGPFIDITVSEHRREYRNVQIVRGGRVVTAEREEIFAGDGTVQTFNVALPVAAAPTVEIVDVLPDGTLNEATRVARDVGIAGIDSGRDWYWSSDRSEISQDQDNVPLSTDERLVVRYRGSYNITISRGSAAAIAERQNVEGGSGRYEHVLENRALESVATTSAEAEALLARYGYIPTVVEGVTRRRGLEAGQLIPVDLPEHEINNSSYLVTDISISMDDSRRLLTTATTISGAWVGGWERYFRKILEARQRISASDASDIFTYSPTLADENVNASATLGIVGRDGVASPFASLDANGRPIFIVGRSIIGGGSVWA